MSWSASHAEPLAAEDIQADAFATSPPGLDASPQEQFEEAVKAAAAIAASGVVGAVDKQFTIRLQGHGNPNHEPASGWVNDTVTVIVSQA